MSKFLNYKNICLIPAAGQGSRFGGAMHKQYENIGNDMMLTYTLRALISAPSVDAIAVIIHPSDVENYQRAIADLPQNSKPILSAIFGGETRAESVANGIKSLQKYNPEYVLIHDAARPFVSVNLIEKIIAALAKHAAVVPVIAVEDTIKEVSQSRPEKILRTVERNNLRRAQTPQGFRFSLLEKLLAENKNYQYTDEAGLCEAKGQDIFLIEGERKNQKITYREDLKMNLASGVPDIRVGNGIDVHALKPAAAGSFIRVCGVDIPHNAQLDGHSDADVGLHALTDAILAAAGLGDIGEHFPPNEMRWKGCDSQHFLSHANNLVREKGGVVHYVDVTLLGEEPKFSPHRQAMREKIAQILALPFERVSVKATTTERLGFFGRKEGLGAVATATVYF